MQINNNGGSHIVIYMDFIESIKYIRKIYLPIDKYMVDILLNEDKGFFIHYK